MGRRPLVTSEQVYREARKQFAERGFHSVRLADIGDALGISAAAVLRHASTKEELMSRAMAPLHSDISVPLKDLELDATKDPQLVLRRLAKEFVTSKNVLRNRSPGGCTPAPLRTLNA